MDEEMATPGRTPAEKGTSLNSASSDGANDAAAQRRRVIAMLRSGPKSTIQLRRDGDILAPAARIMELRRRGFEILSLWVQEPTDCGKLHRVSQYVLVRESGGRL